MCCDSFDRSTMSFPYRILTVCTCIMLGLPFWLVSTDVSLSLTSRAEEGQVYAQATSQCGPCLCQGLHVDCSGRGLSDVPQTGLPLEARVIDLGSNYIAALPDGAFSRFPSLQHLDISHNLLENLTGTGPFAGLTNLTSLNLKGNRLHECRGVQTTYSGTLLYKPRAAGTSKPSGVCFSPFNLTSSLTELDLSDNAFKRLDKDMFTGLCNVTSLDLRQNKIPLNDMAYPKSVFHPMAATLLELYVGENCVEFSLEGCWEYPAKALSVLTNLQTLEMDGLPDTPLPRVFKKRMDNLTSLNLSGNCTCCLGVVDNTTFQFAPRSLKVLNLSCCAIRDIAPTAFKPIRASLDVLDLSLNYALGFDILGEAFYGLQGSVLRELYINAVIHPFTSCVRVSPHNTRFFANTRLERIYARRNMLEQFCLGTLRNMPDTLKFVDLSVNKLMFGSYLQDLKYLKNLEEIVLDGEHHAVNLPDNFPENADSQCRASGSDLPETYQQFGSWASSLAQRSPFWKPLENDENPLPRKRSNQDSPKIRSPHHDQEGLIFQLPPSLTTIESRFNKLFFRLENIHFDANNSLETLDLNFNLLSMWMGNITGFENVTTLKLSNNMCSTVKSSFFQSFPSLTALDVGVNMLRNGVEKDKEGLIFQSLSRLQNLTIAKNYINKIPRKFFQGLISLVMLDLSQNEIDAFDVDIGHMKDLRMLNLSFNNIHFLSQNIMNQLDDIAASTEDDVLVDLTFNPIACTCANMHFLSWIKDSKVNFSKGHRYTCMLADGSYRNMTDIFQELAALRRTCYDNSGLLAGAVSGCLCLLTALLTALAYRHRWKLRYFYYATRLAYWGSHKSPSKDDFDFDAFVSSASDDENFICGEMVKELEERAGLRLNLNFRDFRLGRPIPCNIVDAVQHSRRTLVVLSRHLLASEWCHYEQNMALVEAAHTGREVLLFLLYEEDLPLEELGRDVLYNLQASTYVQYPWGQQATPRLRDAFWARLVAAIRA